jgi:hypothetical protein
VTTTIFRSAVIRTSPRIAYTGDYQPAGLEKQTLRPVVRLLSRRMVGLPLLICLAFVSLAVLVETRQGNSEPVPLELAVA